jgi:hypothetical protein
MKKCFIIICVFSSFTFASQFLTNGNFEQPLTTGWLQTDYGANCVINRATNYDTDPDYEVCVYKGDGTGYVKLYQAVRVPTTDLEFSTNAKLQVWGTSFDCWAGAAVCISYLDESGTLLGNTMICARTQACPWENGATCHIIEVADTLWHTYTLNVDDELVNLPGVHQDEITTIQVELLAQTVDD